VTIPAASLDGMTPRPDAAGKLSGNPGYLTDLIVPGMLHARVLRSPHPHARIAFLDVSAAHAMPGVRTVVTAADLPPAFLLGILVKDQPVLARDVVRHIGEPVAAVAAETVEIAEQAIAAIRVVYRELPVVDDAETALSPGTILLHPGGNLCHRTFYERGDLTAAFAAAAHVVEDVYVTPRQMHAALELEGGVAVPEPDGRLVVHSPSQHPHGVRDVVAAMLGLPTDRVDVVGSPLGGAYGGKEDIHIQPLLALLAHKSDRPVRLALTRPESVAWSVKRHPFRIRMRTACTADGRLLAQDVDALSDTGAYASFGPEVLTTAHETAQGPYRFDAVRAQGRCVYTNNGIAGAFRGFGALQMQMAVEMQIERLARFCALDPVAFRRRNLRAADARGPLEQTVVAQPELAIVADRLAIHPLRSASPRRSGRLRFGTGVSLVTKGEGFPAGAPNAASGLIALADGAIQFRVGLAEMGQGATAVMTAALARALGVAQSDVCAVLGHTIGTPDAGPTSASRGTQVAVRLARTGAPAFRAQILAAAANVLAIGTERLSLGPGGIHVVGDPRNAPALSFPDLAKRVGEIACPVSIEAIDTLDGVGAVHKMFATCGAIAQVAVDECTGRITARRIAVVPACGPVLVPEAFLGQVEGGAVMAAGFALIEDLPAVGGRYLADNLDQYFVPTIADAAVVTVDPVEALAADDPVGVRGIGEIALNAVGPAIAAAVFDALGEPPTRFPVAPAWVLEVLARTGPK
jgi:nicotinate dehydrogenase large molybdopterin subunit